MNGYQFPTPDLSMAMAFLEELDPAGVFTFQTFGDKKGNINPSLNRVLHGTLEQHAEILCKLNSAGAGVFVMINQGDGHVHEGSKTCRTNQNVIRVRSIFLDLDGSPVDPILELPVLPNVVVESSPGRWHAYWFDVPCELSEFGLAQASLATKFEGDRKVNDLARVMRLPGFWHQKAEPFLTRIASPVKELT